MTKIKSDEVLEEIISKYSDILFRICLIILGNKNDAEDALQETIIKYMTKAPVFENEKHEKAWLIKVATNVSKDMHSFFTKRQYINIDDVICYAQEQEETYILETLMKIPDKFRIVLTLYYVENYSVKEISEIIGKTESAVKMRLQKGRKLLSEKYRKEYI